MRRNAGNYLNFKIESRKPVDANSSPVWIRGMRKNRLLNLHNGGKLILGIGMKGRDINQIIKGTSSSIKNRFQVIEGKSHLSGKIGFRRAIWPASDLTRNKQQVARTDRGGLTVFIIESMAMSRKNRFTLNHRVSSFQIDSADEAIQDGMI